MAIRIGLWLSLADAAADRQQPVVFALDVAPDQSAASIAVAYRRPDGAVQITLADHRPGVSWIVDRANELQRAWGGRLILEASGTAAFLVPQLQQVKVTVDSQPRRFYVEACAALDAAVGSHQLRHGAHPALTAAVEVARWAVRGDAGERVLSRRDPTISPLVAAALAVHGLSQPTKARPGRFLAF